MTASLSPGQAPAPSQTPHVSVAHAAGRAVGTVAHAKWPTPRKMRFGTALILGATLIFLLQAMAMVGRSRAALHTVRSDTAPSIIAAQTILAWLADLDANAANELLGNPAQRDAAHRTFEARRVQVTESIVAAAENITFGDAERQPIRQLVDHLGHFLELQADARTKRDLGLLPEAIAAYHAAHEEMQVELGAARELDRVNREQLDNAYNAQRSSETAAQSLALVTGVLLLVALIGFQVFLTRRSRRFFSAPLVAATVLSALSILLVVKSFATAQEDLRSAKEDAFASVHLLWQARAIAYEANGDESRYLLDVGTKAGGGLDEQMFRSNVSTIQSNLFPREIANVTFVGEQEAARVMVARFDDYVNVDARMRALEHAGKHDAAVELCIGSLPTESNAVFALADSALTNTLGINQRVFDTQTEESDEALGRLLKVLPVLAVIIAIGALFGVRPRLREYAV